MSERSIIVTGADAGFFSLLEELVCSIRTAGDTDWIDVGCLDLGLTEEQLARLYVYGVKTRHPVTELDAPHLVSDASKLGYLARPYLPQNFPGYDTYVWLDADTWVQSAEAVRGLVTAARDAGAALIREDEPAYTSNFGLFLWKGKHYLQGYGSSRAFRLLFRPQINNGVFAIRAEAAHWEVWRRYYQTALSRTGLAAPHDQFSLNAAVHLADLPTRFLPATFNWICDLACPQWDEDAGCFCSPDGTHRHIQVMHLAGPIKATDFDIRTTRGHILRGKLRYGARLQPVSA